MSKKEQKRQLKITETVDQISGEIISRNLDSVLFNREPDYIKLYLNDILMLHGLNNSEYRTVLSLLRKMNFDCEVILTTSIRKNLMETMEMPSNTFRHAIVNLITKGILLKKAVNHYLVNPHLFARGSWSDIQKIRMTITYSKEGKLIQTEFGTQKEFEFKSTTFASIE